MNALRNTPPSARDAPLPLAGLKFAVYARKSTDDDRNEDHRSTTRQVEQARAFVERGGGEVLREHVYRDEAQSGAEFKARRGLLNFLDALRNGRPFTAVVMSEQSRLGREQLETGYLLKQIRDAGVRVFYYLTGDEARLDSALDKIMSSLTAFAGEMEREKSRQRARDAAERKIKQNPHMVVGGWCYGYRRAAFRGGQEVPDGVPHDYVIWRIDEAEAEIVRKIFQAYGDDGHGMVRIAKMLNQAPNHLEGNRRYFGGRKIAPPGRSRGWSPSAVRSLLTRDAYHGTRVYGRVTHTDRDGKAGVRVKRDEREWIRRDAPELRIVPEPLWLAVQSRLKAQQALFLRDGQGRLWGRPDQRKLGQYLLSNLAVCRQCGGHISVVGGAPRVYGCREAHSRGTCDNHLTQRVTVVDAAFLTCLQREVLTPERFRYAVACGVARVRERLAQEPDRARTLEQEKATVQRKIQRLVAAIGDGKGPAALVQEIARAEARVHEIEAELARLAAAPALTELDPGKLEEAVAAQLSRFQDLIMSNVSLARQALKKLLQQPMVFTPVEAEAGSRRLLYGFEGVLSFGPLIREVIISAKKPRGGPQGIFTVRPELLVPFAGKWAA